MFPARWLYPTRRRLATTAAFVAFMSLVFFLKPVLEGRGVDLDVAAYVLAIAALYGYLTAPVWESAPSTRYWKSVRERAWKTALSMAAGFAAVLTLDALVTGGVGVGDVVVGAIIGGALFLLVMTMPRIATGRWV